MNQYFVYLFQYQEMYLQKVTKLNFHQLRNGSKSSIAQINSESNMEERLSFLESTAARTLSALNNLTRYIPGFENQQSSNTDDAKGYNQPSSLNHEQ